MHTTQQERLTLLHKITSTRPAECPTRQLIAWLISELQRARSEGWIDTVSACRPPATITVININAEQAAVFGGMIHN